MNKMKKIIAVLVIVACLINNSSVIAKAKEPEFGIVTICLTDGKYQEFEVVVKNKKIYMGIADIATVIGFSYSIEKESICYEAPNGTECIQVFYNGGINTSCGVKYEGWYTDLLEYGGVTFLPLEEMLYLSYATWCVEDGIIYVSHASYNILDFISDNYCDMMMNQNQLKDILLNGQNRWTRSLDSTIQHMIEKFNVSYFVPYLGGYCMEVEEYEELLMLLVEDDKSFLINSDSSFQEQVEDKLNESILNECSNDANALSFLTSIPKEYGTIKELLNTCTSADKYVRMKKIMNIVDLSELNSNEIEALNQNIGEISDAVNIAIAISNVVKKASWAKSMSEDFLNSLSIIASADKHNYASVGDAAIDAANNLINRYENPISAAADDCLMEAINIMGMKAIDVFVSPVSLFINAVQIGNNVLKIKSEYANTVDVKELSYISYQLFSIESVAQLETEYAYISFKNDGNLDVADFDKMRKTILLYLQSNLRSKCFIYELNRRGNETENWENSEEATKLKKQIIQDYAWIIELKATADMDKRLVLESFDDMYTSGDGITREKISMDVVKFNDVTPSTETNEEVFTLYQNAMNKLIANGNWCEQVNMTVNQELIADGLKQRLKQVWEIVSYIYDYQQENPYGFTMNSTATMEVLNLTYGWNLTYANGRIQGKTNIPMGVSASVDSSNMQSIDQEVDLSAIQFGMQCEGIIPINQRSDGNTLFFTIKGEDMNRFYSSWSNAALVNYDINYEDTYFTVEIDSESGIVSSMTVEMKYSMVVQGYNVVEDAVIEYQYSLM